MALNFGFPFSFLLNARLIIIVYKSFKKFFIFKRKNNSLEKINLNKFNKAYGSHPFFLFIKLFDVQSYELRLKIIFLIFIFQLTINV